MSDTERQQTVLGGVAMVACLIACAFALPKLATSHEIQHSEAETRLMVAEFVQEGAALDAVASLAESPALLTHPWMAAVETSLETPADHFAAERERDLNVTSFQIEVSFEELERAEELEKQLLCMTQAIYYESAFEPDSGQIAVAEVILNRVADHRYPNTVCEVVFQGSHRVTGCQFSFTCDGAMSRRPNQERWEHTRKVARHTLLDMYERKTGGATHYHATYVSPYWAPRLVQTAHIQTHIFYRFPRSSRERARIHAAAAAAEVAAPVFVTIAESQDSNISTNAVVTAAP